MQNQFFNQIEIDNRVPFNTSATPDYDAVPVQQHKLSAYLQLDESTPTVYFTHLPDRLHERLTQHNCGAWRIEDGFIYLSEIETADLQLDVYKVSEGELQSVSTYVHDAGVWYSIDFVTPSNLGTSTTNVNQPDNYSTQQWFPTPIYLGERFWRYTVATGHIAAVHQADNVTELELNREDQPQSSFVRIQADDVGFRRGMTFRMTLLSMTGQDSAYRVVISSEDASITYMLDEMIDYFFEYQGHYLGNSKTSAMKFLFRYCFNTYYAHFRVYWPGTPHSEILDIAKRRAESRVRGAFGKRRWNAPSSWAVVEVDGD